MPSESTPPSSSSSFSTRSKRFWRSVRRIVRLRDPHQDLSALLASSEPSAPIAKRILWLARLVAWVRGPAWTLQTGDPARTSAARVKFLLQLLDRQPEWRTNLARTVNSVLAETEAPSLFMQTELTEQSGLFSEMIRRGFDKITPPRPRPNELGYIVETVFNHDIDPEWLELVSEPEWMHLMRALDPESPSGIAARENLERSLSDAVVNLSVQAAAIGLSPEVRDRTRNPERPQQSSPFVDLNRAVILWREAGVNPDLGSILERCRQAMVLAYHTIESQGVSLALLYRLESATALLNRIDLILSVIAPSQASLSGADPVDQGHRLINELVRAQRARNSIDRLLRMNFDVFARKLVEHAGETGEHYITRNTHEYWKMFQAGAGAGLITVLTTLCKFAIGWLHLPVLLDAFVVALNYSGSFLAIQFFGFALATKQPSMTAAALADKLRTVMRREHLGEFAEEIIRITRSQFIAAVGNVGFAIPGALAVAFLYQGVLHRPVITPEYAEKVIASMHPWKSLSIFYAATAGVLLWLSSLCAGWVQNWVIYRGLPQAIAHHRLINDLLGERRSKALGDWIANNSSGLGGNISIGFLLAFVPASGVLTGLPIDVRHVTLSSASLSIALVSFPREALTWQHVVPPILGVMLIGVFNFGVSTALALFVAVRAQRVKGTVVRALLAYTAWEFKRNPFRFFFPTGEDQPSAPHGHGH